MELDIMNSASHIEFNTCTKNGPRNRTKHDLKNLLKPFNFYSQQN